MSTRDSLISILENNQSKFAEVGNEVLFCFQDVTLLTWGIGRVRKKGFGIQIPYVDNNDKHSNKYEDVLKIITRDKDKDENESIEVSYVISPVNGLETVNWECTDEILMDLVKEIKDIHFDNSNNLIYANYVDNPNFAEEENEEDDNIDDVVDDDCEQTTNIQGSVFLQKLLFPFFGGTPNEDGDNDNEECDDNLLNELFDGSIDNNTAAAIRLEATLLIPSFLNKYFTEDFDLKELTTFRGSNIGTINIDNENFYLIIYTFPIPLEGASILLECIIIDKSNLLPPKCYILERSILGNYMLCGIENTMHLNFGTYDGRISIPDFVQYVSENFLLNLDESIINYIPSYPYGNVNVKITDS